MILNLNLSLTVSYELSRIYFKNIAELDFPNHDHNFSRLPRTYVLSEHVGNR